MVEGFLRSSEERVKVAVVRNLLEFMSVFESEERRESLIDVFMGLQINNRKWRVREAIASQIDRLSLFFTGENIVKFVLPISFRLCSD